ncbi:quinoprotein dehydrogenase-associated SoxYZ-like carrier [Rhodovulum sp. DZ06]|uniref:quinoprotein dehydrogenase-associated SoxYZ-like carrier n=1 Tax=Rhodovulum sp. DZ06 TaxID=3425126 RepID=UPI003D327920
MTTKMTFAGTRAALAFALGAAPAAALEGPRTPLDDPFDSAIFADRQVEVLGDPEKIRFDDRVIVRAPLSAEDSFNVPVEVDATALSDVEEIVVFVDWGPIPKILSYFPGKAEPRIALRFKIDQATPIRAAVRTADGAWHVGGTEIDAAGGGCTAPAVAYAADDWEEKLGEVNGRLWADTGRVRMIVDHPMDTGLADGIPVYIIEDLELSTPEGEVMARLQLHEPVNEDPAFTLFFAEGSLPNTLELRGRDNGGAQIRATLRGAPTE